MAGHVGRPREFDEDEIISKIMGVFWKLGYEGTGLSDIMEATGLKKGSLYKAFGSKHGMYIRALKHYELMVVDGGVTMLTTSTEPPDVRLKTFMSAPIEAAWRENDWRGCFLCNASADHAAMDEITRQQVKRGYDKLEKALRLPIAEIQPEWSSEKVAKNAQLLLSVYAGMRVMARSAVERQRLEGAKDMALDHVL